MNLKTLSKVFCIGFCVLVTSCARDQVTHPHQDWSVPLVIYGRMLDEETLAGMPSYERNQEVCKRTDAAFRRVDLLNDIEDRIALGAEQTICTESARVQDSEGSNASNYPTR